MMGCICKMKFGQEIERVEEMGGGWWRRENEGDNRGRFQRAKKKEIERG